LIKENLANNNLE